MAKILQLGKSNTIKLSTVLTITETPRGTLCTSPDFLDADIGSVTVIDGWNIPLIHEREKWFENYSGIQIAAAEVDPSAEGRYQITLAAAHNFKPKQKVSMGHFGTPAAHLGALEVFRLDNTNPLIIYVDTKTYYNLKETNPVNFVGEFLFDTHRYSGGARLGFMSLNLDVGSSVGGELRTALVATKNPASGVTFQTREAAGEVVWSRFYPVGSQISVDFSGVDIQTQGYVPPTGDQAPAIGDEIRLMLVFYGETGTAVATAIDIDVDLTYNINTVVDTDKHPW